MADKKAPFEVLEAYHHVAAGDDLWTVLEGPEKETAEALKEDARFSALGDLQFVQFGDAPPDQIAARIRNRPGRNLVLVGMSKWGPDHWRALDQNRAQLEGRGLVVFALTAQACKRLARHAPNLTSLLGGRFYVAAEDIPKLSIAEKRKRLEKLRRQFRMSDREMLRKRSRGELPIDQSLAEWLVLLGKGSLL